jgi:hypothetical protein
MSDAAHQPAAAQWRSRVGTDSAVVNEAALGVGRFAPLASAAHREAINPHTDQDRDSDHEDQRAVPAVDDPVDLDVAQVDERKCEPPNPPRMRPAINRARSRRGADGARTQRSPPPAGRNSARQCRAGARATARRGPAGGRAAGTEEAINARARSGASSHQAPRVAHRSVTRWAARTSYCPRGSSSSIRRARS